MSRVWRFPCGGCGRPVQSNQPGICCEACLFWLHTKCVSISTSDYVNLQASMGGWCCPNCWREALPFSNCSLPSEETITPAFSTPIATSSPHPSRNSSHSSLVSSVWNSNPPSIQQESKTDPCKLNTTIFYSNCRSLLHQLTDLHLLANGSSPATIMALVETWLNDSVLDVELQLPAYNLYRRDRDRHGGAIAVYIDRSVLAKKVATPSVVLGG